MIVKEDKDGLEISQSSDGYKAVQTYTVTNIPVSGRFPLAQVMGAPKVPKVNDPFGQFDIVVLERIVGTDAKLVNGARVTVKYGLPDSSAGVGGAGVATSRTRIEMKVGTISEKTFFDINNKFLKVKYQGTASFGAILSQIQQAEVQRPVFRFTARRDEAKIPFAKAELYTGAINSTVYFGFPAKTLLILGVSNSETNKGLSQEVAYEFAFRRKTWKHEANIIIGGRLPSDAAIGNGIEFYDVFEAIDFAGLGISLKI